MRWTTKHSLLSTTLAVGLLGLGVAQAQAQFHARETEQWDRRFAERSELRYHQPRFLSSYGGPVVQEYGYGAPYGAAYMPPCPGDGYIWLHGAWVFRDRPVVRDYGYANFGGEHREQHFDRHFDRDFDGRFRR